MLFKYDPKMTKVKGRYNVRFYDPETRRRYSHSLGTSDKDIAQRRYREICRAYELGEFDPRRDKFHFGSITLKIAADGFLASRKGEWSPATLKDYTAFTGLVCKMLPADIQLRHLSPSDCRKIIDHPPSRAAQRGYYRRLRSFLNWCLKQGHLRVSPLEDVRQPKPQGDQRIPFLTREEFSRLVQAIDEAALLAETTASRGSLVRLSRVVRFDVATGLRLAELRALRWRDIDSDAERIHVVGKGEKYRTLPLFPDANSVLQEIRDEYEREFNTPPRLSSQVFHGLPYTDTSHAVTEYLVAAGLKEKVGPKAVHALRHTFASWCVMAGVDIFTVSKWLGHGSVLVTQMYAHLAPDYAPEVAIRAFGGEAKTPKW